MANLFNVPTYDKQVLERLLKYSQTREGTKFYAGVGARNTPEFYLEHMSAAGKFLKEQGWVLRSGGAAGADKAFERHIRTWSTKDIYLPWLGYGKSPSFIAGSTNAARNLVMTHHPNPKALNQTSMQFHGRNVHLMLGPELTSPVRFVLCYTIKGMPVGGTGMALRIAKAHDIPVFNMGNTDLNEIQLGIQKIVMKN